MVQDVTEGVQKLQTRFDRFEQQQAQPLRPAAQRPTVATKDFCGQPATPSTYADDVTQGDNWEETRVYRPKSSRFGFNYESTQRSAGREDLASAFSATCGVISNGIVHTCTVTTIKVRCNLNRLVGGQFLTTGKIQTQVRTPNDLRQQNSIR